MKALTTAMALGLVLVSGSALAASYYELSDTERNYANGTQLRAATHYLDRSEFVDYSQSAEDTGNAAQSHIYNTDIYQGN